MARDRHVALVQSFHARVRASRNRKRLKVRRQRVGCFLLLAKRWLWFFDEAILVWTWNFLTDSMAVLLQGSVLIYTEVFGDE